MSGPAQESLPDFPFDQLRRYPDLEAPNLFAVDATDRLLLDEAAPDIITAGSGQVVTIGDNYGALTLGAIALLDQATTSAANVGEEAEGSSIVSAEPAAVRIHQDRLTSRRALAHNAESLGMAGRFEEADLGPGLLDGARVVLVQLPKSLDALREIAQLVADSARPDVVCYFGGRVKFLTPTMNAVLADSFNSVQASLARQKSRLLVARGPLPQADNGNRNDSAGTGGQRPTKFPVCRFDDELELWICAHGAAFGGTKLDAGTRLLAKNIHAMNPAASDAVDLGCGTGVLAALLARARPELRVVATDDSAAAVQSTVATLGRNALDGRVTVVQDDALGEFPAASADLIVCNPPFHIGSSVHAGAALRLFDGARRTLRPGGELWTVYNTHLNYRNALRRQVGPTKVVDRSAKFTVTVSTRGTGH